jgi:hypothetical protein
MTYLSKKPAPDLSVRGLLKNIKAIGFKSFTIKLDDKPLSLLLGLTAAEILPVNFMVFRHTPEDLEKLKDVYQVLLSNLSEIRKQANVKIHLIDTFKFKEELDKMIPVMDTSNSQESAGHLSEIIVARHVSNISSTGWLNPVTLSDLYRSSDNHDKLEVGADTPLIRMTTKQAMDDMLDSKNLSSRLTNDLIKLIKKNYSMEELLLENDAVLFFERTKPMSFVQKMEVFNCAREELKDYIKSKEWIRHE